METFFSSGLNAQIPPAGRRELVERWLRQEHEGLAQVQRHGLSGASHERRIEQLRAEMPALIGPS
jgi:hypothetical protein